MLAAIQWTPFYQLLLRFACLFCPESQTSKTNPTVITPYGTVEGIKIASRKGIEADAFLGIPYAQPPIAELRFQKPQPTIKWERTFKATKHGHVCASHIVIPSDTSQSEDCLVLNILRPANLPASSSQPVLVYVHGGAFQSGTGNSFNRNGQIEQFTSHGIIVVSINYRLSAFGYFTTASSNAPGNYGLWDQLQALQFIHEIIGSFGGDPNNVTIWGQSAGAASVSWLSLRPEAKHLFSKVISMSGSAQDLWANNDILKPSQTVAESLGCNYTSEDIVPCLQQFSTKQVTKAALQGVHSLAFDDRVNFARYCPRFDGDFINYTTFKGAIANAPKRPHLFGLNTQEDGGNAIITTSNAHYFPLSLKKAKNYTIHDLKTMVENLIARKDLFGDNANAAAEAIFAFYSRPQPDSNYTHDFYAQSFVQVISDIRFNVPSLREAVEKAKAGFNDVYFYKYTHVPKGLHNFVDGTEHTDDLHAIMDGGTTVTQIVEEFGELIRNFVKTGVPSTTYLTAKAIDPTSSKVPFVRIDAPRFTNHEDLWSDRAALWDTVASKFGYDWPLGRKVDHEI
uniref:Carboxylic ester hydrolase n=1 Tax=Panagrellus redivivus TaxID=6233 RepID=A0A7E4VUT9_PANRE